MEQWQIVISILAMIFNIGAVAGIRNWLSTGGEKLFFGRGRGSFVLLFVLVFIEQLALNHFQAFDSAQAFVTFLQQVSGMVTAAMGAHVGGGLVADALKKQ